MATFGQTSVGGSSESGWFGLGLYCKFACGVAGDLTKIRIAAWTALTDKTIKLAIYADSAGAPGSLLGSGQATITRASAPTQPSEWTEVTIAGVSVTATDYWLAWATDSGNVSVAYDAGGTRRYNSVAYASFPPNPAGSVSNINAIQSIYAEVTESGGGGASVPVFVHHLRQQGIG